MENCKDPTCVFSLKTKKCIKPNSYVQYLPQCKKQNIPLAKCKENYKLNIDEIKKNACNYYRENLENKKDYKTSCPKNRRPVNNNCSSEYPVLKNNKYNIKCCYKEKKEKPIINSYKSTKKPMSNPFKKIVMPEKELYFDKKTNKYYKILKTYQNKVKPAKVK